MLDVFIRIPIMDGFKYKQKGMQILCYSYLSYKLSFYFTTVEVQVTATY